jgi:hypothetical protein
MNGADPVHGGKKRVRAVCGVEEQKSFRRPWKPSLARALS